MGVATERDLRDYFRMPVADANRGQMVDDMILPIWVLGGMWAPLGLVAASGPSPARAT